jgi:hypothetical protein
MKRFQAHDVPLLKTVPRNQGCISRSRGTALKLAGVGFLIGTIGCAIARAPIKDTPQIVATPRAGEVSIAAKPGDAIGDVQPVYVSIANGTDTPRSVVPSQIFALDSSGNRIAPLPPGEAARQAGNSGELKAALLSGATSGALGAGLGAGLGAIAGSLIHSGAVGAGVGAAIAGGEAGLEGVAAGAPKADQQADRQLSSLALQPGEVRRNFTASGYVFFPKGTYQQLQMVLVDGESGDTQVVNQPWK